MFYHKIETPYMRSEEGDKKLIIGKFRNETLEYLKDNIFECTEKIDGTNTGIVWDGYKVSFQGHSANTTIPPHLMAALESIFGGPEAEELFEQKFGDKPVILFGEGYGAKLQTNGHLYRPNDDSFILFDVYMPESDLFLKREDVEDIAKCFGIDVVPIIMEGTLQDAIDFVKTRPQSTIGDHSHAMEGLVLRPKVELRDRCGKRVIVKVRVKDFA